MAKRLNLEGMTALVTGGGSGMVLEYARQLAAQGCTLILVSNRPEELTAAAGALQDRYGVTVATLEADLAERDAATRVLGWCDAQGFTVDILINNAGVFFMEYLGAGNLGKARTMMALHVETTTEMCILFGERMKQRGRGYILNMASMTARIPAPGIAVYSASKAYLESVGRGFSYEMRPFGVYVATISPAAVDTGLYPLGDRLRKALRRLGVIRTPEWLVRRALRALFHGRRLVRPGGMNFLLPPLIGVLPARTIDRLGMKWIFRK